MAGVSNGEQTKSNALELNTIISADWQGWRLMAQNRRSLVGRFFIGRFLDYFGRLSVVLMIPENRLLIPIPIEAMHNLLICNMTRGKIGRLAGTIGRLSVDSRATGEPGIGRLLENVGR